MVRKKVWNNSISGRLNIRNTVILCVAFLLLFLAICQINGKLIYQKEEQVFASYIENTLVSVDDKLKDMGRVSLMSMADAKTQDVLLSWGSMDEEKRREQEEYLENFYMSLVTIRNDIHGIYMMDTESLVFYYDMENPTLGAEDGKEQMVQQILLMDTEPMQVGNCNLAVQGHPVCMEYSGIYETDPYYANCVWLIRDIYSFSPHTRIGTIAITVPVAKLKELLENTLGDDMFYLLVAESGKIVCSQDGGLLMQNINHVNEELGTLLKEDGTDTVTWGGRECFVMHRTSKDSGLTLLVGKQTGHIKREITSFLKYYILLCVAVLVLILAMTSINVRRMLSPIRQLAHDMTHFKSQNLSARYPIRSQDETGQLMQSFNDMMDMLEELIEKQYKDKVRIQEGRLKEQNLAMLYLKSQVNPHFLYNTLDTIRIHAQMNGDKDVAYMLMQLVDFFRLSVKVDTPVVTLEHEIELIESYFSLMCYRYPEICWEQDIDPDLLDVEVPNFILQPIVENSILHGLRNKGYRGCVRITIRKVDEEGEYIEILVQDDGVGFTEEERGHVQELLAEWTDENEEDFSVRKSIGIRNIQNRLKMFYSKECGLSYIEKKKGGVTARILIQSRGCFIGQER